MKIAFASCFDPIAETEQSVWDRVREHNPEVLLLLGDSVYMDYGLGGNYRLEASKSWPPQIFADELYSRYSKQAAIESFRELISSVSSVFTTWDDHDFAWNGAYGANQGEDEDDNLTRSGNSEYVPREKRLISRTLHLQFRQWLNDKPLKDYPAQPNLGSILSNEQDTGIEYSKDLSGVRIIMTDGRYYRQAQERRSSSQMLGTEQRSWLEGLLSDPDTINLLCSGTALTKGSECWEEYSDLDWLAGVDLGRSVILSGDIHKNKLLQHASLQDVLEVTSSGAARPGIFGKWEFLRAVGNFGMLTIEGRDLQAEIFDEDGIEKSRTITFD
jgi:alkaline phosphatase D